MPHKGYLWWFILLWCLIYGGWTPRCEARTTTTKEIPENLSNAVRLARHFTQASMEGGQEKRKEEGNESKIFKQELDIKKASNNLASKGMIFHEDFDDGETSQWELIFGGEVSGKCGSVSGDALCFGGEDEESWMSGVKSSVNHADIKIRHAVTKAINTFAAHRILFSLAIAKPFTGIEDLQSDMSLSDLSTDVMLSNANASSHNLFACYVNLEYKSPGSPWIMLQQFNDMNYTQAIHHHGNSPSMVQLGGQNFITRGNKAFVYVQHEVELPMEARSRATKFRWQQVSNPKGKPVVQGSTVDTTDDSAWAIDEISFPTLGPPGVVLTTNFNPGENTEIHGKVASVFVHFSTEVFNLVPSKFVVEGGGRIVSFSKVSSNIQGHLGGGDLFSLKVVLGPGQTTISLPEKSCSNSSGKGNIESNTLVF